MQPQEMRNKYNPYSSDYHSVVVGFSFFHDDIFYFLEEMRSSFIVDAFFFRLVYVLRGFYAKM
ncbi:hypothetical protein C3V43_07640 [Bacteroides heparinolyticus]|uniref:Uncharacterized protein n=1 Tax=Prevotella heparinolytica TaxID=28113 RepID=A0A2R3MRS2_9BACE|nr:hypothetical protein C3V43_07640 [Bacteroides heparinolyticus]RRD92043.1 hypothetical protein EII33_05545 [Bacteroides heparinolyticus]TCO91104.1 hypothetical protein EV202_11412 [Bacteroides heparinolyticus]